MLQVSNSIARTIPRTLLERVSAAIDALSCDTVRARAAGPHVLLCVRGQEPYGRVTPLGGGSFGLAFRANEASSSHTNAWEPLLLVDDLLSIVEHALVAVDAIPSV
jgi:hypothetical protein